MASNASKIWLFEAYNLLCAVYFFENGHSSFGKEKLHGLKTYYVTIFMYKLRTIARFCIVFATQKVQKQRNRLRKK